MTAPLMEGQLAAKFGTRLALTIGPAVVAISFLLAMRISANNNHCISVAGTNPKGRRPDEDA